MDKIIVDIDPAFLISYDKLPKEIKKKFYKQLHFLKDNPKHPSLQIHKMQGTDGFWEFYIDDFYRCVFTKTDNIYRLRYVGPHDIIDKIK